MSAKLTPAFTLRSWVAAAAMALLAPTLRAHETGLSTLQISSNADGHTLLKLQFSASDVASLLPVADSLPDGEIDGVEFIQSRPALEALLVRWVELSPVEIGTLPITQVTVVRDLATGDLIWNGTVNGDLDATWQAQLPLLESLPHDHRQVVTIMDAKGNHIQESLASAAKPNLQWAWSEHPGETSTAPSPPEPSSSFGDFFGLGIEHILTGYDHLLFLAGLLVAARRWGETFGIITSFTIAHSITLGLAALDLIHIPGNWIEPLIAASIVYVSVENLLRQKEGPKGRWGLTFCFGLIHGFGFAGALRDLGLGANGTNVVTPLLGFNLGVELGQFAVAVAVVPLLALARQSKATAPYLNPVASSIVLTLGGFWLVQRTLM